jgi:AcrR family transcriptional regulator
MKRRATPTLSRQDRAKQHDTVRCRHDDILRCALNHFAMHGFQEADLDSVAADLSCAKGTLYNYFPTKRALFKAAADLVMRELLERTQIHPQDDVLDGLERAVRAYLKFFDEHPEYVELLIQERAQMRGSGPSTYFAYRDANAARWKAAFRKLIKEGRLRPMPVARPFEIIGDLVYGTIFTNVMSGRKKSLSAQAKDVLDVLFHGLLTPEEASRRAAKQKRAMKGKTRGRKGDQLG